MPTKVYLRGIEQDMYQEYETSLLKKGEIPLPFDDWKKDFLEGNSRNTKINIEETTIKLEKNFYTYNEAAEVLNKTVSTIKNYIKNEEHGLILLEKNKLDKNSVNDLAIRNDLSHKEWALKEKYSNYVLDLFKISKLPLGYEKWLNINEDKRDNYQKEFHEDIDLELYISFKDTLNILGLAETTVKAYIRNGVFTPLIQGYSGFLLKESVINYRKNLSVALERKNKEKEDQKEKEKRQELLEEKLRNCFVGGYIQCNNAFIKETLVTHITPVHNEIRIIHNDELNSPSFLSDDFGEIIKFKDKEETRKMTIFILKIIERKKVNK